MSTPCKFVPSHYPAHDKHPRTRAQGKTVMFSHLVYATHHKIELETLANQVIMHTCDNPRCIEVSHLVLGTQKANIQDMWAKGRQGVKGMSGSTHPMAKLNEETVAEIRKSTATGKTLALRYGVSRGTISMIRNYKIWKEIKTEEKTA